MYTDHLRPCARSPVIFVGTSSARIMMRRHAHRPFLYCTALLLLATAGCQVPKFQGPQVQTPPQGFSMNRETFLQGRLFSQMDAIHHDAWVEAAWGNFSGIYINGFAGEMSRAHLEDERNAIINRTMGELIEYGEIEELTVDGRTAWGWTEWRRLENGGLEYMVYRALIPYDTISYAVEFLTGDPALKVRPDSLRMIVASFGIGKTTWNLPLIAMLAGVLLLLGNTLRSRVAAKAARARSITLVHIPTKEEKKEAEKKRQAEEQAKGAASPPGGEGSPPGTEESPAARDESPAAGEGKPAEDDNVARAIFDQIDKKEHPPS